MVSVDRGRYGCVIDESDEEDEAGGGEQAQGKVDRVPADESGMEFDRQLEQEIRKKIGDGDGNAASSGDGLAWGPAAGDSPDCGSQEEGQQEGDET